MSTSDSVIQFLRRRDYTFVKVLGQGACGQTVLLHDDLIDSHFVCKKYMPYSEDRRQELFKGFLREIKLLHELHHKNVVRVFNYYLYPDKLTGYILMEYVEGQDLEEYLREKPESVNELFLQSIEGFAYLESAEILHRDIRVQNIMVRNDGALKIIDLGFGKRIEQPEDFDKSISLNWWCELPKEFAKSTYDYSTEVYFVGKMFEKLIGELGLEHFKYQALLSRMCKFDPAERIRSFIDLRTKIQLNQADDIEFTEQERDTYRLFAHELSGKVTKIETGAKYVSDLEYIRTRLDAVYRNCMLEDTIPDCAVILRCFLNGGYYYRKAGFQTWILKDFLRFLRTATNEKQRIALANLSSRFDSIVRYTMASNEDDIPF